MTGNRSSEILKIKDRLIAASAIGSCALLVSCASSESDSVGCEVVVTEQNNELVFNLETEGMATDDYQPSGVAWTFDGKAQLDESFGRDVTNDYSEYKDGTYYVNALVSMDIISTDPNFVPPWGKGELINCDPVSVEVDNNF